MKNQFKMSKRRKWRHGRCEHSSAAATWATWGIAKVVIVFACTSKSFKVKLQKWYIWYKISSKLGGNDQLYFFRNSSFIPMHMRTEVKYLKIKWQWNCTCAHSCACFFFNWKFCDNWWAMFCRTINFVHLLKSMG